MKHFGSTGRRSSGRRFTGRALALAATTVVATAAALAGAAPASAHHTTVRGTCAAGADGSWTVTWTVTNAMADVDAKIKTITVSPADTSVTGFAAETPLPGGGTVTGTQVVPQNTPRATLQVVAVWPSRNVEHTDEGVVTIDQALCTPSSSPSPSPSASASASPSAPASPGPSPSASPSLPPLPGEPDVDIVFTCDQLRFTLDNPKDGVELDLVLTPGKGTVVKLTVPAGEKKTATFAAGKGFVLTVSAEEWNGETVKIPWEEPEDCDNGQGGGLPVTGTAVGGIAGAAAVLLAIGAGLFVMARRRIRFTA